MEQKLVDFNGSEIMAIKCSDEKIYVGVKWICNGLGLTEGQTRAERIKVNEDIVISKGRKKIVLPTNGGKQEVLCIELDFLPLWLAKINANIIEDSNVQNCLIEYQLKAKDVLAEAFINKRSKIYDMTEYQKMVVQTREENAKIRKAKILLDLANRYDGTFRQVLESHATKIITGEYLLPLPELERKTYSATEIAELLGITSNKVGKLANKHNLKTDEYGKLFHDKSRYSNKEVESFRYYDNVIPVIRSLLA